MLRTGMSVVILALTCGSLFAGTVTVYTPNAGDAQYAWNTKYGSYGYTTGANSVGIYLYFGAPYGNDHTVSIFEVPISSLAGQTVTGASLVVESLGFGTNYYYGSASIGWLDVGSKVLTGDVVTDGLGPDSMSLPGGLTIYHSDTVPGTAGGKTFDVLSYVQSDLAAGRAFSTFVMSGSRETWGSIYTAESGSGPRIIATTVPEPASLGLLAFGALGILARRMKQ
ncbi:MAG TPA: hypothetical protein DCX07_06535 [Phycisphaerales bacterium]|nr:hypothetical protein [Phycisphaerales bacterium]